MQTLPDFPMERPAAALSDPGSLLADTLIASAPGIFYLYTEQGQFKRWNNNFERVSGYSPPEIAAMHPLDFFVGVDRRRVSEKIREVFEQGEASVEANFVSKDGTQTPFHFTGKRVEISGCVCLVGIGIDISDRKRSEEALRLSEERYRTTLEGIMEGCQLIGFDWRYLYLNPAAAIHNRRPNGELLGRTIFEVWPGIEGAPVYALLRRCMEERVAVHEEVRFDFPDGAQGWFDVRCQPVPEGIFTLSIDISERRHHELEIERLRQLYAALSLVNQSIVHSQSREQLFRHVCRVVVRYGGMRMAWIGWEKPETRVIECVAQAGDDGYLQAIRVRSDVSEEGCGPAGTAFREGRTYLCNDMLTDPATQPWRDAILRFGYRSGAVIPLRLNGLVRGTLAVYSDAPAFFQGNEISLLEEAASDVSFALDNFDRDEKRHRAEEALRKSEASLAAAQSQAKIGSWEFDIATAGITWSAEMFRIFRRDTARGMPSFAELVESIHPGDRAEFLDLHHEALAHGRSHAQFFRVSAEGTAPRWIEVRGDFHKDSAGVTDQLSGTAQDVTERHEAEEEIRRLNADLEARVAARTAQLEAANKEMEAFSYSVSHDLRAPLRAINGFARIVLADYVAQIPPEVRRYLERIAKGGERMGALIDDLLALSRLSRRPMESVLLDNFKLVKIVLDELQLQRDSNATITVQEMPPCWGDSGLLKQVWTNLISNACKYSRKRESPLIEIGSKAENGETIFYVRDNGAGFDMRYVHKLFGVFQRLHRSDEFEGTGVGLAIVQRIVHRHGGRVWAEAELNRGATFYFTIGSEKIP